MNVGFWCSDPEKPLGVALPLVFQEHFREAKLAGGDTFKTSRLPAAASAASSIHPYRPAGKSTTLWDQDCVYSVAELEERLRRTSQAIAHLQKQIVRGEETYFEETSGHGSNLFKGFDTFVDSRAAVDGSLTNSASRRMPGDFRWFSSSCSNIAKYIKTTTATTTATTVAGTMPGTTSSTTGASSCSLSGTNFQMEVVRLTKEQMQAHHQASKTKTTTASPRQQRPATPCSFVREKRPLDSSSNDKPQDDRPAKEPKTEATSEAKSVPSSESGGKDGESSSPGRRGRKRKGHI